MSARAKRALALRLTLLAEKFPDHSTDGAAEDGSEPEQPELLQRPSTDEQCLSRRAGRIDRGIGDRNGNQMNKGEGKANGDRRKTGRNPAMCRSQNDDQEKRRQDDLNQQR